MGHSQKLNETKAVSDFEEMMKNAPSVRISLSPCLDDREVKGRGLLPNRRPTEEQRGKVFMIDMKQKYMLADASMKKLPLITPKRQTDPPEIVKIAISKPST